MMTRQTTAQKDNLGVVLVAPMFSQGTNLNVDSNYVYLKQILPEMARQSPDTLFLMLFPDPHYGQGKWFYVPDDLSSHPRIQFLSWKYDTNARTGVMGFDPERYAHIDLRYGPTSYYLHAIEMGAALYGGYKQASNNMSRPVIIAQHHYVIHDSLPYAFEFMRSRLWYQMGGALMADRAIYNSDHAHRMWEESMGRYLNANAQQEIRQKSDTIRFGLVTGDEPVAPEADDETRISIIYNHRFEAYKQYRLTGELLLDLKREFDFDVLVTQVAGARTKDFPVDRTMYAPQRMDYLRNIAVPGINVTNSLHETFCISALDSIMMGQLVVAPNAVTFPELVPPDYPYLFNSVDHQRAILREIMSDFPRIYNTWRPRLIEHARQRFGLEGYVARVLDVFVAEETKRRQQVPREHVAEAADTVFAELKPGKLYSLVDTHRAFKRRAGTADQATPITRWTREASMRGFKFVWKDGVQIVRP